MSLANWQSLNRFMLWALVAGLPVTGNAQVPPSGDEWELVNSVGGFSYDSIAQAEADYADNWRCKGSYECQFTYSSGMYHFWYRERQEEPPESQCPTDVIPGAPVMNSSGGADVNVGAVSGTYDVDGCAYACYVNTGKFDGKTPYSETLECTGMGKPTDEITGDEPDPAPENCVLDPTTGKQYCANGDPENPTIETPDGETVEVDDNSICGVQNGTFGCVDFTEEGCGQFNGKKVCYTPDGEKVESDSPDHPDNGGNLDGDPTNDVNDPRPESEGGDPNNQPGDTTGEGDGATEGTAREQLGELRQIDDKLKGIGDSLDNLEEANEGNGQQIQQEVEQGMDEAGDAAVGELDELIDDVDQPGPMKADDLGRFSGGLTDVLGAQSQCEDLTLGKGDLSLTLSCSDTAVIRDVLGFIVYLLTFWRLFQIVTRKPA